ncbi:MULTISPECIES: hypothetical protein [Sphingomonadaceae]|uniref:DUF7673 domain-containing protein n=1 Tax=Novosphingobium panipatense TaxID=428991 RepID=A0ABY1R0E6_9SPHN|nr:MULTISPECIES: hypothetical protein [Sphingomonadaceae]SMP83118.1 hypothetical protein SAMN06296065_1404 [Novosphingobium panipatense]
MNETDNIPHSEAQAALDRLLTVALSDTGQSRITANFLLAWWNAHDWGGFDIADLFGVDRAIAADMASIFAYLGQHGVATYADAFGRKGEMVELIRLWRRADVETAEA